MHNMIKHHLPPGLDVNIGDIIDGWGISWIEPNKYTELFPRPINENEIPDYYFFVLVKLDKESEKYKSIPGIVPYEHLMNSNLSTLIKNCIDVMENRI